MLEIIFLILALALMLIGLAGTIIPILPSVPLVYAGYAVYGLATGWRDYGLGIMAVLGAITLIIVLLDYLAGALGARKFGASRAGMWGSIIGAILGVIFLNIIGLILGTFIGALIGELIVGRTMHEAVKSGWGAFLGFLAGSFVKIVTATAMIGVFIWLII